MVKAHQVCAEYVQKVSKHQKMEAHAFLQHEWDHSAREHTSVRTTTLSN